MADVFAASASKSRRSLLFREVPRDITAQNTRASQHNRTHEARAEGKATHSSHTTNLRSVSTCQPYGHVSAKKVIAQENACDNASGGN